MCINEFQHQKFLDCGLSFVVNQSSTDYTSTIPFTDEVEFSRNDTCDWIVGEQILFRMSVSESDVGLTAWEIWKNILALGCISVGVFILSYINLVRSVRK